MKIYVLKSCDTCRKALREMREAGLQPQVIDVVADGVPGTEINRFLGAFGEKLVNRRSTTWRNLAETERVGAPGALLMAHPKLMKRPVVDLGDQLFLGWDEKVRRSVLGLGA